MLAGLTTRHPFLATVSDFPFENHPPPAASEEVLPAELTPWPASGTLCIHRTQNCLSSGHKKERNLTLCDNMDDLGGMTLREITQLEKDEYHMISLIKSKINE